MVRINVTEKPPMTNNILGSGYDKDSIMKYAYRSDWIKQIDSSI